MSRVSAADLQIDRGTWIPGNPEWVRETYGLPHDAEHIELSETAVWHRGGVAWHLAPKPSRFHKHTVHTYGVMGFRQVFRCACGAIADNIHQEWVQLDKPRVRGLL